MIYLLIDVFSFILKISVDEFERILRKCSRYALFNESGIQSFGNRVYCMCLLTFYDKLLCLLIKSCYICHPVKNSQRFLKSDCL